MYTVEYVSDSQSMIDAALRIPSVLWAQFFFTVAENNRSVSFCFSTFTGHEIWIPPNHWDGISEKK